MIWRVRSMAVDKMGTYEVGVVSEAGYRMVLVVDPQTISNLTLGDRITIRIQKERT